MTGANDPEIDEAWEDADAVLLHVGGVDAEAEEWRREQADLRRMLGVDDAFGYHFVDTDRPNNLDACGDGARAPRAPWAPVSARPAEAREPDEDAPTRPARHPFPCLEGGRYSGCLGMACALDTCWTGSATVSFARRTREQSHVSTMLYLPGAPCHECACLREDEIPAPRAAGQARGAGRGAHEDSGERTGDERTGKARCEENDAAGPERATLRRITCARGLWEHPISLSSFVTKRIPMRELDEPRQCPGFAPRPEPHPAVAAHLRRRRERARRLREERGGRQDT